MWQKRQYKLLKEDIEKVLASLDDAGNLHELVKESLTQPRRGLSLEAGYDRPWPLLPLLVCEAISGRYDDAIPIATTLQFLLAAGDVFDDIEDADSSYSLSAKYGPAIATNVATTLLVLGEKAITRLKNRGITDSVIIRVFETINSYKTISCAGQHLDLSSNQEEGISEDKCLKISYMKSASQIMCACNTGAMLAADDQELIETFIKFGYNLGIAAQITNDIQGIIYGNDIIKRKITLPVIFALAQTNNEIHEQLKLAFHGFSVSKPEPTRIKELLFRTGAINYAAVKLEFYKQEAADALMQAEVAGASIERLKMFVE